VTLEGTVIHKSGLITGGRSTHSTSKNWDEKVVEGKKILAINFKMFSDLVFRLATSKGQPPFVSEGAAKAEA
jgi:chromosome segregation ATPase